MYPPVSVGQVRVSNTHDITLGGRLHIPAGTAIWVPHHAMQNVSYNWDEPEKFKPGAPSYPVNSIAPGCVLLRQAFAVSSASS